MTTIAIIVTPIASSPGWYRANLPNGDLLVAFSRAPFLDAARRLIELGYPPEGRVVMRHAGSAVDSLRAMIGDAAALTVTTASNGRPVFAVRAAAASPIRSPKGAATPLAREVEIRTGGAAATDSPPIAPYDSPKVMEPPTQDQRTDEVKGASLAASTAGRTQTRKRKDD
jgi:hypothetical protein